MGKTGDTRNPKTGFRISDRRAQRPARPPAAARIASPGGGRSRRARLLASLHDLRQVALHPDGRRCIQRSGRDLDDVLAMKIPDRRYLAWAVGLAACAALPLF